MTEEMTVANKQKLVSDLKVVVADTEELLRSTAGAAGEKRPDLECHLRALRMRADDPDVHAVEGARVDVECEHLLG